MTDGLDKAATELSRSQALLAKFASDQPTAADVIGPMPALAVVTDGRAWVAVSRRFAHLVGREPKDLLGTAWHELVHPDDRASSIEAAEELLDRPDVGGQPTEGEFSNRYLVPDGVVRLRWRWAKASPSRPWVVAIAEIES